MIKRLRIKFIAITFGITAAILIFFCAAILISNYSRNEREAYDQLDKIAVESVRPDFSFQFRNNRAPLGLLVAIIDPSGYYTAIYGDNFYSAEDIQEIVETAVSKPDSQGSIGDLRYKFYTVNTQYLMVAVDKSIEAEIFRSLLTTVLISGIAGLIVLFVIIFFLSYPVTNPVKSAIHKQKRFISDSSHELKTPLTIISASAEILERQMEENQDPSLMKKWLDNIKTQSIRMNLLTQDLTALSKIDEIEHKAKPVEFDLSGIISNSVLMFESPVFEKGKTLKTDIAENITINGDPQSVSKAVSILLDNALKHSDEHGEISVSLKKSGSRPVLTVKNSGSEITEKEAGKLFERFYRSDSARARSAGSGLGLSILKSLCSLNGWKISADASVKDYLSFNIVF